MVNKCGIEKADDQLIISILSKLGPDYSVFVSTFHATMLATSNWKIPSLSTFFDSLTKERDKLIQMVSLRYSKGKDHALIVQGIKNALSKECKTVKEKKPKSDNEDESSKPTYMKVQ